MKKYKILLALLFACINSYSQTKSEALQELLSTYNTLNTFNGSALIMYKGDVLLNSGFGVRSVPGKSKSYSTNIYQVGSITKNLLCVLYDKPYKKPVVREEISFTNEEVQKYSGEYQLDGNFRLKIFLENNRLIAQRIGENDRFEMFLFKKDSFFLKSFEAELIFSVAATGKVEKVCLLQGNKTMCSKNGN